MGQSSFTPSAADFGDQLRVVISYNGDALSLGAGTVLEDPTEVIAVSGGNWKHPQTWSTNAIPGANDDVVLNATWDLTGWRSTIRNLPTP